MAKKREPVVSEQADLDEIMDQSHARMRLEMGESKVLLGGRADAKLVGLYLPHLVLRYLFQSTVLPLGGRMMQITGMEMSCKSAFLYWLYLLFRLNKGRAKHIDVETKDSELLRNSILRYDAKAVQLSRADAQEDWQEQLLSFVDDKGGLKFDLAKSGHLDKRPIIMGVDSFTAKACREVQDKIVEAGHAGRDHPVEALSFSKFLKTLPPKFQDIPWFLAGTTHLKPTFDRYGHPIDTIGGGMAPKFQETFEVRMAKISRNSIQQASREGIGICLKTNKNSIGPFDKEIEVDFLWYMDRETARQVTWWDWDTATIELILGTNCARDPMAKFKAKTNELKELTGIRGDGTTMAHSSILGIPASDPQPYAVVAQELERNQDLLKQVHMVMGIQEHTPFVAGTSFRETVKLAREESGTDDGSYVAQALKNTED